MAFVASYETFEGPLDLMLHLIKENKLDIFDLDMSVLCDEYLAYLDKMDELHLEVESEYLVELSTLIEYKSKKLLPKREAELSDDYQEDPKDALVRRLLEYQRFKEVTQELAVPYMERSRQLSKAMSDTKELEKDDEDEIFYDGNVSDLYKAMNRVLRRLKLAMPIETRYTQKEVSIDDRLLVIRARLKDLDDIFSLEVLADDCKTIEEAVVTFLAVLDLIKDGVLDLAIKDEDKIYLKRRER